MFLLHKASLLMSHTFNKNIRFYYNGESVTIMFFEGYLKELLKKKEIYGDGRMKRMIIAFLKKVFNNRTKFDYSC